MTSAASALFFKVVVRRLTTGPNPFGWELHRDDTVVPVQVSADRFGSMESAYIAGQAKLADLLPQKRTTARQL